MRPLFTRLYDLLKNKETNPYEDYLTEIFSPILENKNFLLSFLNHFLQIDLEKRFLSNIKLFTQRTYTKLENHSVDSRPDLVLSFTYKNKNHLLFIENKLGSTEGYKQLSRYADHLAIHQKQGYQTHLLYITKFYDPKEVDHYSHKNFTQIRWYQVYNWLREYESDLYCKQVLNYMEELQLNTSRKFTPIDIHAIQNAQRLQSMLDETLDGKVSKKFSQLFGKPKQWSHRTTQLRDNNLYILINDQTDWKFIGCGFEFTEEEYPQVTVYIEVHPNSRSKEETKKAIQAFCHTTSDWEFEQPLDENEYFYGYCSISFVHFLANEDHIDAIQNYLVEKLEELHQLKVKNQHLKWLNN